MLDGADTLPLFITPKYPEIKADLWENRGNPFSIIAEIRIKMRAAGLPDDEIKQFFDEATRGSIMDLIDVCERWVTITSHEPWATRRTLRTPK